MRRKLTLTNRLRRVTDCTVLTLLAIVSVEVFLCRGHLRPLRVAGASMAPRLRGFHWICPCDACHFPNAVAREFMPVDQRLVCPNCGHVYSVTSGYWQSGARIWVDRATWPWSRRRWDLAVVRDPLAHGRWALKRLIGLPGERVTIAYGDVQINGHIPRRTWHDISRMMILVHDDTFRITRAADPADNTTDNNTTDSDTLHDARANAAGTGVTQRSDMTTRIRSTWQFRADSRWAVVDSAPPGYSLRSASGTPEWLTFRHVRPLPPPLAGRQAGSVSDLLGDAQSLSREIHSIHDLIVTARIERDEAAHTLCLKWRDAHHTWQVHWNLVTGQIRCHQDGSPFPEKSTAPTFLGEVQLAFGMWDGELLVIADGETIFRHSISRGQKSTAHQELPPRGSPTPISLSGLEGTWKVTNLRVWRDVHYLAPDGQGSVWDAGRRLGVDEYLVLGDHSAVSRDARNWPGHAVSAAQMVGRAHAIPGAAKAGELPF